MHEPFFGATFDARMRWVPNAYLTDPQARGMAFPLRSRCRWCEERIWRNSPMMTWATAGSDVDCHIYTHITAREATGEIVGWHYSYVEAASFGAEHFYAYPEQGGLTIRPLDWDDLERRYADAEETWN
jgi:hypothetical protein